MNNEQPISEKVMKSLIESSSLDNLLIFTTAIDMQESDEPLTSTQEVVLAKITTELDQGSFLSKNLLKIFVAFKNRDILHNSDSVHISKNFPQVEAYEDRKDIIQAHAKERAYEDIKERKADRQARTEAEATRLAGEKRKKALKKYRKERNEDQKVKLRILQKQADFLGPIVDSMGLSGKKKNATITNRIIQALRPYLPKRKNKVEANEESK